MSTLALPTANLHGTPDLEELHGDVASEVRKLLSLLEEASPNARDYYLIGDSAFREASAEYGLVCALVSRVLSEVSCISCGDTSFLDAQASAELWAMSEAAPRSPKMGPMVHLNGTSRSSLNGQYRSVHAHCLVVLEALSRIVPNMRDYATAQDWTRARGEHLHRRNAITQVQGYILMLLQKIKAS